MAHTWRQTGVMRTADVDDYDRSTTAVDHGTNTVARLINFIGGIIMSLLALRFVLMLLGANKGNALVDAVYALSYPLAAPFFGIFNYQQQFGASRFEFETLIAIAVYALITWALMRLVTIANRRVDV